jgi:hypothetical protein
VGKRVQEIEEVDPRDIQAERADYPDPRANKPGRRPKSRLGEANAAEVHQDVLKHFFPDFVNWLKEVRDPRKKIDLCTYPIEYILMTVLMMHCGQTGSRRQLGRELAGKRLGGNIWRMIGKAYANVVCHPDTMNGVLEALDPQEFEKLIVAIVTRLRKCRVLDRFRFDRLLTVAIDGTKILSFKKQHCEHCTHQTHKNGKTTYFHCVLVAKIVTPIGLVIPLAFEFIENPGAEYDKQDCELKAWRRLYKKIRTLYPRLKINLVADGIYAEEQTFKDCDEAGWNYINVLKDDKLPTVTRQLPTESSGVWTGIRTLETSNAAKEPITRTVRFKTPVTYHGEIVHVVELEDINKEGERDYYNKWVTNVKPNKDNALDLAQTGRLRWKIENEGINTQKNGGYEMEHGYGLKRNAWKNYYLTLQVSQLLNDLVRFGDFLQKTTLNPKATFLAVFGTMRNFAKRLIECLRNGLPRLDRPPSLSPRFQIRFLLL